MFCGSKDFRVIIFRSSSILFLFFFFLCFFWFYFSNFFYSFGLQFLPTSAEFSVRSPISFCIDLKSLTFLSIIFFVTFCVRAYSEYYIDHYDNAKFLFLMLSFFLSIIFLILRESFYILATTWDFLGLTSLFLIIFYPNKGSHYNSFLTAFFNRLGDVGLAYCFFLRISEPINSFFSSDSYLILFVCFLCCFTKRAQFPLSRWLPAAISAPTPISAIVHSSTLVTAGVLLFQKFSYLIERNSLFVILYLISLLTFLLGGLIANFEPDFKKIVAFSTISQISLIVLFCSFLLFWLRISHIIFHALFKTLLFRVVGVYLLILIGNQLSKVLINRALEKSIIFFLLVRIFRITGLSYSSSFYSKDLILEILNSNNDWRGFFLILLCSILTILYRRKVFSFLNSFSKFSFLGFKKVLIKKYIIFFSLSVLTMGRMFKDILFVDALVQVTKLDLALCLIIFLIFIGKKFKFPKIGLALTENVFLIKFLTFRRNRVFIFKIPLEFNSLDSLMFKPRSFLKTSRIYFKFLPSLTYLALLIFILDLLW